MTREMNQRRLQEIILIVITSCITQGCSDSTRFSFVLNGKSRQYDKSGAELSVGEKGTWKLVLHGDRPGDSDMPDDEHSDVVILELDEKLLKLGTMKINAEAMFSYTAGQDPDTFRPVQGHHPAILSMRATHACYCRWPHRFQQSLSGTLTLSDIAEGTISGSLNLKLSGGFPGSDMPSNGQFDITFFESLYN